MFHAAIIAVTRSVPEHECSPYTRPLNNAANLELTQLMVRVNNNAANVTLCEELQD